MSSVLDKVLGAARQLGASDVHLKVGLPPIFRVKGDLRTVANVPPLTQEAVEEFGLGMMNPASATSMTRTGTSISPTPRRTATAIASTSCSNAEAWAW